MLNAQSLQVNVLYMMQVMFLIIYVIVHALGFGI